MLHIEPELVARAQEGDELACRAIVERLHRPILATIYRFLGSRCRNEVEDVGQEVFLRVFRSIGSFDAARGVAFSTWVYSIAKHYCFDLAKRRRLTTVALDSGDDPPTDIPDRGNAGTIDRAEASELGAKVRDALAVLNEEYRTAFVLREYQGLPYREIANVVGVPEPTIKTRIHRARRALRGLLSGYLAATA